MQLPESLLLHGVGMWELGAAPSLDQSDQVTWQHDNDSDASDSDASDSCVQSTPPAFDTVHSPSNSVQETELSEPETPVIWYALIRPRML